MGNENDRIDADIGTATDIDIGNKTDTAGEPGSYDIETLMRQYGNDVLRTAYSYVNDKSAAEDCFQEAFIKAYKNLQNFRGESSIKTWLIRITVNVCKDYLKSAYQKHVVPMMEFEEDAIVSENDFEEVENKDRNRQILEAVNSLPEHYRATGGLSSPATSIPWRWLSRSQRCTPTQWTEKRRLSHAVPA